MLQHPKHLFFMSGGESWLPLFWLLVAFLIVVKRLTCCCLLSVRSSDNGEAKNGA
jgi:hypothetical protein